MDSDTAAPLACSATDINFIQDLHETLCHDSVNRDYGGLLTTVSRHLECFQEAITTATALKEFSPWAPLVCTVTRDQEPAVGPSKIQITGPVLDGDLEVVANSPREESDIVPESNPLFVPRHRV